MQQWQDALAEAVGLLQVGLTGHDEVLDAERVPCAAVLKVEESMAHPHLRGRKTVRRVKYDTIGEFDIPGMPVKFSGWPDRTEVRASRVGADNSAIVSELLELSAGELRM